MPVYRPISDVDSTGVKTYTPSSPATIWDKVDDVTADDDTTKIRMHDSPPARLTSVKFEPITPPTVDDTVSFTMRYKITDGAPLLGFYGISQGAVFIGQNVLNAQPEWTDVTQILTAPQVASISDWSDVRFVIEQIFGGGEIEVTQVYLTVTPPHVPPARPAIDVIIPTRGQDVIIGKRGQDVMVPNIPA